MPSRTVVLVVAAICSALFSFAAYARDVADAGRQSQATVVRTEAASPDADILRSQLRSLDYSELIQALKHRSPFDPGAGYAFGAPHQLLVSDLTPAEERLVGVVIVDDQQQSSLFETVMRVAKVYAATGQLPADGTELFSELQDAGSAAEFLSLDPFAQYKLACSAINPVTGKFYSSFCAGKWSPGGVDISRETDPEYMRNHWTSYVDTNGGAPQIWRVVVYGETPGTVLLDKHIAINARARSAAE